MQEHIIIKDDQDKIHKFHTMGELVKYLDSFKMSFLPDNFTYEIVQPRGTGGNTTSMRKKIHHV